MEIEVRNDSYHELARILREQGWYRPATGRILLELCVHLVMLLGGLGLAVTTKYLAVRIVAYLVSAFGALGVATNTHTSSHYATSRRLRLNQILTYFGYSFLFGVWASHWWHKHCVVHHPTPNVIGIDSDVDLTHFG